MTDPAQPQQSESIDDISRVVDTDVDNDLDDDDDLLEEDDDVIVNTA